MEKHYLAAVMASGAAVGSAALFPGLGIPPQAFAVVGMAAFFTGVVQPWQVYLLALLLILVGVAISVVETGWAKTRWTFRPPCDG